MYYSCYSTHILQQPYISETSPVRISFVTDQAGAAGQINGNIIVDLVGRKLKSPVFSFYRGEEEMPTPNEVLRDGTLRYLFTENDQPIREILVPDHLPGEVLPIDIYDVPWATNYYAEPTKTFFTIPLYKGEKKLSGIRVTNFNNVSNVATIY